MNHLSCGSLFSAFFGFLLTWNFGIAQESQLDKTRTHIEKWVQTRQLIAKKRADWRVEQENISQSIGLLKKELNLLVNEIKQAKELDSEADIDKRRINLSLEDLKKANKVVVDALWKMERQALIIMSWFPEPLKDRTAGVRNRIPLEQKDLRDFSAAERMQNIVAMLNEADRFNSAISMAIEFRKDAGGKERQVQVVYLGLGQAYFVNQNNTIAGTGLPGPEGWVWSLNNDLAPKIRKVIDIYENRRPAEFVSVPVEIK